MAVSRQRYFIPSAGTYYIDLARSCSLQERRLHRQKQMYTVYGGLYKDAQGTIIEMNSLPHNWIVKRSINRAFYIWRKMIAKALENSSTEATGKWNDFKVAMNRGHAQNWATLGAPGGVLLPVDAADQNIYVNTPEWEISTMTTDDPTEDAGGVTVSQDQWYNFVVGPHYEDAAINGHKQFIGVGLVQSWLDSRPDPVDATEGEPATGVQIGDPYLNFFDAGDSADERLGEINDEGDQPPYDAEYVFGNANANAGGQFNLQRQSVGHTSTSNPIVTIQGFQCINGLIEIVVQNDPGASGAELILDVETNGVKF